MIKMEFAEYLILPIAEIKNEMISACISIHDNLKEEKVFFLISDVDHCVSCMIIRHLLCIYKCLPTFSSS